MNLVSRSERSRSSKEVARYLQDKMQDIAGCEITAEAANMMSQMDSGNDIQVDISGSD